LLDAQRISELISGTIRADGKQIQDEMLYRRFRTRTRHDVLNPTPSDSRLFSLHSFFACRLTAYFSLKFKSRLDAISGQLTPGRQCERCLGISVLCRCCSLFTRFSVVQVLPISRHRQDIILFPRDSHSSRNAYARGRFFGGLGLFGYLHKPMVDTARYGRRVCQITYVHGSDCGSALRRIPELLALVATAHVPVLCHQFFFAARLLTSMCMVGLRRGGVRGGNLSDDDVPCLPGCAPSQCTREGARR